MFYIIHSPRAYAVSILILISSFLDYLNFVRVYKSEKKLVETDMNIAEIAESSGFISPAYYTKIFRQYKDCTPSNYRKYKRI